MKINNKGFTLKREHLVKKTNNTNLEKGRFDAFNQLI